LDGYSRILIPELNTGQLASLLRDKLGVTVSQLNKVSGQPLTVHEVVDAIIEHAPETNAQTKQHRVNS